mmetsp:Transcript_34894/g.105188  ORF Transcript_34894/g.105188 Transcript_34894/m.105188 type:complete len:160 (+) Transcript_34894:129-608(+)
MPTMLPLRDTSTSLQVDLLPPPVNMTDVEHLFSDVVEDLAVFGAAGGADRGSAVPSSPAFDPPASPAKSDDAFSPQATLAAFDLDLCSGDSGDFFSSLPPSVSFGAVGAVPGVSHAGVSEAAGSQEGFDRSAFLRGGVGSSKKVPKGTRKIPPYETVAC